jgi:cardiolipin synthase A/B
MPDTNPHYARFPWRSGNSFELLVDGTQFYPRMLESIRLARESVLLEMYLIESGVVATQFIDAFREVAQRGVNVRLLLDDYGSLGLGRYDRRRLAQKNITVASYNRLSFGKWFNNMARDHRKILVVDGEVAFVGGAGITDEFAPPRKRARPWRETMLEIRGKVVADWQTLFNRTWNDTTGEDLPEVTVAPENENDGSLGRVAVASGLRAQGIMRSLVERVRSAERTIWLSTAYFVPSWKLRRALRYAARKGADVRLLLPGPRTDHPAVRLAGHRYYASLLENGIRIFEYQPRFLHSKALVCDQWVTIGSSNFDRWNFRWNLEANQSVDDLEFANQVMKMFEQDFDECIEITAEQWAQRPRRVRLRERFWGRVDTWLHRIGSGRRTSSGRRTK